MKRLKVLYKRSGDIALDDPDDADGAPPGHTLSARGGVIATHLPSLRGLPATLVRYFQSLAMGGTHFD